jgi:hypothetical protein
MNMNMNMTMNSTNGGISNTYRCLRSGEENSETESSVNHLIYDLVDVLVCSVMLTCSERERLTQTIRH